MVGKGRQAGNGLADLHGGVGHGSDHWHVPAEVAEYLLDAHAGYCGYDDLAAGQVRGDIGQHVHHLLGLDGNHDDAGLLHRTAVVRLDNESLLSQVTERFHLAAGKDQVLRPVGSRGHCTFRDGRPDIAAADNGEFAKGSIGLFLSHFNPDSTLSGTQRLPSLVSNNL
jgi:hypothetical protein